MNAYYTFKIILYFIQARWILHFKNRKLLLLWQQFQLRRFLPFVLKNSAILPGASASIKLQDFPIMDKQVMNARFQQHNTKNISREEALQVATAAEHTRDFTPTIHGITIGLSSGTSGNSSVFLVSPSERCRWAGALLARVLPSRYVSQIINPFKPSIKIAFFLRANSNLYATLRSSRINFQFFDLLQGVPYSLSALNTLQPDILVAPPSVLKELSQASHHKTLHILPSHIISVAEKLEPDDANHIFKSFGVAPHQIYQATEGFLAYTCEKGRLHLNETFLHIEKEWLDTTHKRFYPIITDFTRDTQTVVRYRLNDILLLSEQPCCCGRAEMTLESIEGRSDEVFYLPALNHQNLITIYPDFIRRIFLFLHASIDEYTVTQNGMYWEVAILSHHHNLTQVQKEVVRECKHLCSVLHVIEPTLNFTSWSPHTPGAKKRRIVLKTPPSLPFNPKI